MVDNKKIIEKFNIKQQIEKLDKELRDIPDVVDVEYDLNGFLSGIYQVIFLLQYNITAERSDYWEARKMLKQRAINVINNNDLYKTSDVIEDYGRHFYFVAGCKKTTSSKSNS